MSPRPPASTAPPRHRAGSRLGHRAALALAAACVPIAATAVAATAPAATPGSGSGIASGTRAVRGSATYFRERHTLRHTLRDTRRGHSPPETARLHAALEPDRPGQSTTVAVDLEISAPRGRTPSPVASFDLHAPAGLNLLSSQLGLATCTRRTLVVRGRNGCPANSLLGRGRASAEVASDAGVLGARATLTAFFGGTEGDALSVLLDIHVGTPVYGRVVIPSRLLTDSPPFGTQLQTPVPPIAVGPEGPYVAITQLQMTLGPRGLTYYRRVHGRRIAFTPSGPPVPTPSPRGGYRFAVTLHFTDGTVAAARSAVACSALPR